MINDLWSFYHWGCLYKHHLHIGLGTETRYQYGTGTYGTGMY